MVVVSLSVSRIGPFGFLHVFRSRPDLFHLLVWAVVEVEVEVEVRYVGGAAPLEGGPDRIEQSLSRFLLNPAPCGESLETVERSGLVLMMNGDLARK